MKVAIIGIKDIDFTDSKTGREISGIQLFVTYPQKGIDGLASAKIFLDRRTVNELDKYPCPGSELHIDYDMKGRIVGVEST